MRLSLQAVEVMSDQEFKASALAAYERGELGERAISMPAARAVGQAVRHPGVAPPSVQPVRVDGRMTKPRDR